MDKTDIEVCSKGYALSVEDWRMIRDLKGGTRAMRTAGHKWLPQEPKETPQQYSNRLARSFLYAGYEEMTASLVGKPFVKPVTIKGEDELDPRLRSIASNVDREGTTLTQFAKKVLTTAVDYGLCFVMVDFPQQTGRETKAEEEAKGSRPFFVHICPWDLIGWQVDTDQATGISRVTMVKIKECRIEPLGEYADHEVEYIRVYRENDWELWRKTPPSQPNTDPQYVRVAGGTHTFNGVPIVAFYTNQVGLMMGSPAMSSLAWLNIEHWQSSSDQLNALRFARIGILFGAGFTEEDEKRNNKGDPNNPVGMIGPNRAIFAESPDAKLMYVEHSGKAMGIGKDHLESLERKMDVAGLQPLVSRRSGNVTATADVLDEARSSSDIQTWIRDEEFALEKCYEFAAKWIRVTLPEDFSIDIFNEFTLSLRSEQDVVALMQSRLAGEISRETYLTELRRRGLIADYIDIQAEMARIESEGPPLGLVQPIQNVGPGKNDE